MTDTLVGPFTAKNKYGSYVMELRGRIIYSKVIGLIGFTVSNKFNHHFCHMIDSFNKQRFAYMGDFTECDGYTAEAATTLLPPREYARDNGCVVDGFMIHSPLLIDQVDKLRKASGAIKSMQDSLFTSDASCTKYLLKQLELIDAYYDSADSNMS